MKTNNIGKTITIYICAAISILALFSGDALAIIAFPLIIIMNIIGYFLVRNKYARHPELSVLLSTNDTLLLYLCKIGGCFAIALTISVIIIDLSCTGDIRSLCLLGFVVLFYLSPSVDDGVKRVQDKYRKE